MNGERISAGDIATSTRDDQFQAFFVVENPRLQRFATMLVGDAHEGAELAQEALARVYARWSRIKDGAPGAYARQAIVNLVRSHHRTRKLRALKPVPEWAGPHREAGAETDRIGDSLQILDALSALSPVRRATILLRFYEDMSDYEIARLLDRPLGTVKSDIHRGLRQLRSSLEDVRSGGGHP